MKPPVFEYTAVRSIDEAVAELNWADGVEVIMQIVAQEKTAALLRKLEAARR